MIPEMISESYAYSLTSEELRITGELHFHSLLTLYYLLVSLLNLKLYDLLQTIQYSIAACMS